MTEHTTITIITRIDKQFVESLMFVWSFHCRNRFNISESETEAKFIDCTAFGIHSFRISAGVCKMVGGTDLAEDICIFPDTLFAANVQLGRLQLQCAQDP